MSSREKGGGGENLWVFRNRPLYYTSADPRDATLAACFHTASEITSPGTSCNEGDPLRGRHHLAWDTPASRGTRASVSYVD